MQLALEKKLNDELTKERGGRHGGKGHEFQRYWALCHLLKIDLERDNYLVLLEFIEDVAVLNNESNPEKIEFFQLKKKDGNSSWTKTALAKPSKDKLSILAKLFESRNISPDTSATISFVSNSPVALTLKNKLDSTHLPTFEAIDVDASILDPLQKDIATELQVEPDKIQWDKLSFIKSPLSLNDLENHALGHVVTYLGSKYPDHNARADIFFRLLYGEIKIRATSTEDANTFEDLKKLRGISKSQMTSMLAQVIARKPVMDVILNVLEASVSEGVPFVEREAIKVAGRRFTVDRINQSNLLLVALEQAVIKHKNELPDNLVTTWQVVTWIYNQLIIMPNWNNYSALGKPYILALIIYGISE